MTETPTTASEPAATPSRRGRQTVGDMIRSLLVVLAVVALVFLFSTRDAPKQTVREVGFAAQLAQTRDTASYDVLGPVGLPPGWKATSVRGLADNGAVTWHLGMVTPGGRYAAVEQSDGSRRRFISEFADGADPAGQMTIGDRTWRRLDGGDPERHALLLSGDGVTTLVAGSATWAELRTLAASLQGS